MRIPRSSFLIAVALLLCGATIPTTVAGSPTATPDNAHHEGQPVRTISPEATATPEATPKVTPPRATSTSVAAVPATPLPPDHNPDFAAPNTPTPQATLSIEPAATRAPAMTFAPATIRIPAIGVDAAVVPVGVTPEGAMEAPEQYHEVGWYAPGPIPGEIGRAVLAGHVDSRTGPAVFYRLDQLQPGDQIAVGFGGGYTERTFTVRESRQLPADGSPAVVVFSPTDKTELILITCSGSFDRTAGRYLERLVVYAEMDATSSEGSE